MEIKFDKIKGQKFEIGRTINFALCDCKKCDFMNCPKKNYAPKVKQHTYTIKEFWEFYKKDIKERQSFYLTTDEVTDLLNQCMNFPKGTYWNLDYSIFDIDNETPTSIFIEKFSRKGMEMSIGYIGLSYKNSFKITDIDLTERQCLLAKRIQNYLNQLYCFYLESKEEYVGWLSPEGVFNHCCYGGHYQWASDFFNRMKSIKGQMYDDELIKCGWVKITNYQNCIKNGFNIQNYISDWFDSKTWITEEQNKWLLENHPILLKEYFNWKNKENNNE